MHIEYDNRFIWCKSREELIPIELSLEYWRGRRGVAFVIKTEIVAIEELSKAEEIIRQRLVTRDFDSSLLKIVDEESTLSISFRAWHNFCWESCHLGLSQKDYCYLLTEILKFHGKMIDYLEKLPKCRDIFNPEDIRRFKRRDTYDLEEISRFLKRKLWEVTQ